jgi:prepilin-type N-terminal cleavage/methylation domain-containing protein/prepilin-type processing-associated H-X9-DG protein
MNRPGKFFRSAEKFRFSSRHFAPSQAGFTMTELMIVIAIMAILSAILLPALSKGRSRSQAISCLNNLRQLQICWQMYEQDYDVLPANNHVNGTKFLAGMSDTTGASWCPGDARIDTTTENIERGQLFRYNKSTAIYHCPSDNSKANGAIGGAQILRTRSYGMSSSIGCEVVSFPTYTRISEIIDPPPSSLFVFIDAHENAIGDAHFTLYPELLNATKTWIDMPSDRHDQAGNLSFADGHIERWKWEAPKVFLQYQQSCDGPKDLSDMRRLQSAMRRH